MTTESLEIARSRYEIGKAAFENGQYRESVQNLEQASALLGKNTRLGGEVEIWLVNAYEAAGRSEEAIALCQELSRHPHYEVRHQAKRLAYILKAPKLNRPKEWMTEIPDFSIMSGNKSQMMIAAKPNKSPSVKKPVAKEYIDLSTVNTQDNNFVWVALTVVALTISYLVWLSFE